ncbi:MAG TPA: glycosyltransferase, partial [Actinomycetota bacterium]|nr:glycosyltransferase [Actinomycetota bacterium]
RQFREAASRGEGFDRIIVHFQPGILYRPGARAAISKVRTSLSLLRLVRRRTQTEILVHEADRPTLWRPDHLILRQVFAEASLLFHTEAERKALEHHYRVRVRARLVDHREGVVVRNPQARGEARRRLGLSPNEVLFLCAGFLHPMKAYERAVRAFAEVGAPGRLAIVGSVRNETEENLAYAAKLRSLADQTPGVSFIEAFLTDEEFGAWIAAADRLVLPYTRAWSSGVLARARVIGTPAIVSAVGGLAEQAGPDDELFHSDDDLRRLLRRHASREWSAQAVGEEESGT